MTHAPDLNTPFRIADAVKQAFPHGGMTMSGLRREAARGRLVLERIAGKDFVTLAAIGAMRELCRVKPEWPVASKQKGTAEPGTMSTAAAALHARIKQRQVEDKVARDVERAAAKAKYAAERLAKQRTS